MANIDNGELLYSHIKTLNVLCVEDCKITQLLLGSIINEMVEKVFFADDGKEGLEKYQENKIDLIVTDYNMPNYNGLDMVEKIRDEDSNIPIILISSLEDLDVAIRAINLDINAFVKKPIDKNELIEAFKKTAKVYIANNFLQEQKNDQILELKQKSEYSTHQEDLAFAKELNILRNDYYYQMTDYKDNISLLDFIYHPKDVMSGDAYSARHIDDHCTLYIVVDGMGKGLSASLTTMIFTSFANHIIDKMLFLDDFDFSILIHETMEYIKPILLEYEALSVDYVLINNEEHTLVYSKFSMPPILMQNRKNEIVKVKSNNPPMSKYSPTFNIDSVDISDITKFILYSDGIVENETIFDEKPYSHYIEEDFLKAFTKEDLSKSFEQKTKTQDDDITLVFVNKITQYSKNIAHKKFESKLQSIENASIWYETIWEKFNSQKDVSSRAGIVFTELIMNAYEHGNLGIKPKLKHSLMESDTYLEELSQRELTCDKEIDVSVDLVEHLDEEYMITKISDEGDGFDTQTLSEIFRNSKKFHGRGVFVSRKNSYGIYYNSKGNSVLFISKIENQTS
jgi:CheY-like chemotaxis protein